MLFHLHTIDRLYFFQAQRIEMLYLIELLCDLARKLFQGILRFRPAMLMDTFGRRCSVRNYYVAPVALVGCHIVVCR